MGVSRVLLLGIVALAASCADEPPPNVLLIVADDLGWNDVGFHGGEARTPHLDALAREGAEVERLYTYPLCTPSRAALLTGQDPMGYGLAYSPLRPWDEGGLPASVPTLAERFRDAGYATAAVGKWHLGHAHPAMHPNRRGFDSFYGFLNGAVDYYTHRSRDGAHDWQRDGVSLREEGYATDLLADEAVRVLRARDPARPWFLYLAFNAPHGPLQASPELVAHYESIEDPDRRIHCAMVEALDIAVGRILTTLEESGEADRTLVVFTSDHGGARQEGANNEPFRGGKGSPFEGGIRATTLLRWPGVFEGGGHLRGPRSILDLPRSILDAAGLPAEDLPGHSLRDQADASRVILLAARNPGWLSHIAVQGDWKYVRRLKDDDGEVRHRLFDLARDLGETTDLAPDDPERVAPLSEAVDRWLEGRPPGAEVDIQNARDEPPPGWRAPSDWAMRDS